MGWMTPQAEPCEICGGDRCGHDYERFSFDITTCQGCGAYSDEFGTHVRNGEECGQFL